MDHFKANDLCGGLRGAPPPPQPKMFSISFSFSGILTKSCVGPQRLGVPSWIRPLISSSTFIGRRLANEDTQRRKIPVADLRRGTRHAPGSKFFQFQAYFGKNWQNRMLAPPPPLESWRPHLGEILDPPLDPFMVYSH